MPKSQVATIVWTEQSRQNAISIKSYLNSNFSPKEVDHFYAIIKSFEIAVCAFPRLYPLSPSSKKIRRAVLSKVLSAYYRINGNQIEVIALLDNRSDSSQLFWIFFKLKKTLYKWLPYFIQAEIAKYEKNAMRNKSINHMQVVGCTLVIL